MSDIEKGATTHNNNINNGTGVAGNTATAGGQGQLWDPSHAYAVRQPSRIGNPGAL